MCMMLAGQQILVRQPPDPAIASLSALLRMRGNNGSTSFVDDTGKTWTSTGGAALSTAQGKFYGSSMLCGSGKRISTVTDPDFGFGAGAYTLEGWLYATANSTVDRCIFDTRTASVQGIALYATATFGGSKAFTLYNNTGIICFEATSTNVPLNEWCHWRVTHSGTTSYLFRNGVVVASGTDARTLPATNPIVFGANYLGSQPTIGYLDMLRAHKGTALSTSAFDPPRGPFPNY